MSTYNFLKEALLCFPLEFVMFSVIFQKQTFPQFYTQKMTKIFFVFSENSFPLSAKIKKCFPPPHCMVCISCFFFFSVVFWKYIFKNRSFSENSIHDNKNFRIFSNDHSKFSKNFVSKSRNKTYLSAVGSKCCLPTSPSPSFMSMCYFLNSPLCTCMYWSHLVCWVADIRNLMDTSALATSFPVRVPVKLGL